MAGMGWLRGAKRRQCNLQVELVMAIILGLSDASVSTWEGRVCADVKRTTDHSYVAGDEEIQTPVLEAWSEVTQKRCRNLCR